MGFLAKQYVIKNSDDNILYNEQGPLRFSTEKLAQSFLEAAVKDGFPEGSAKIEEGIYFSLDEKEFVDDPIYKFN